MRSRVRSTRENRRFSCLEKVLEDFFHGQLAYAALALAAVAQETKPPAAKTFTDSFLTVPCVGDLSADAW